MAILFSDKFNYAIDSEPANYTFRNQDGTPPNFRVRQDGELDGSKNLKNFDGLWNWSRYDPISVGDAKLSLRVGVVATIADIRLTLRSNTFSATPSNFPDDGYQFVLDTINNISLKRLDGNATLTTLISKSFPGTSSKSDFMMRLECEGSNIRGFIDEILELSTTDATHTTGKLILGGFENGNRGVFDDLVLSDFVPAAAGGHGRRGRR